MTTSSIAYLVSSAVVAVAVSVSAASASAQGCGDSASVRKGDWIVDVTYHSGVGVSTRLAYVTTRVEHMAALGIADVATGVASVTDGTSNTIFFAERVPVVVSCDDVNRDGVAGISVLQFSLRDGRSGAVVPVAVVPRDGELDRFGVEAVTIVIGGLAVTGTANVREWVFGTEQPR